MFRKSSLVRDSRGQSLLETALMLPLLLTLILNAVNFGYFVWITLNLTSATRNGIEYAIQGSSTPRNGTLPGRGSLSSTSEATVRALIAQELAAYNKDSKLEVNVCAVGAGQTDAEHPACETGQPDPEAANGFALVHVDVSYTFQPPIPLTPFTLALQSMPGCTNGATTCVLTRHADMRAMGS